MNLPRWLRLSLILPLLGLNLFVLRQALLRLAPFPALFISAALIAFKFFASTPDADVGGKGVRLRCLNANFGTIAAAMAAASLPRADGLLADLGCSSMQIDDPSRGFTWKADGPLDRAALASAQLRRRRPDHGPVRVVAEAAEPELRQRTFPPPA